MPRLASTLSAAVLACVLSVGCSATDRPRGDGADPLAAAPPQPLPPVPAVVEPENYDEGKFLVNPFWYWGQLSERSGYPYTGHRFGCDLIYIPTINYCKYFDHPERLTRIDRVWETDAQGFTDDWDMFWQQDRPTYLTRWSQR